MNTAYQTHIQQSPAGSNTPSEKGSEALERLTEQYSAIFERNIRDFSEPHMGARLFFFGGLLLMVAVFIRLIQWMLGYGLLSIKGSSGLGASNVMDDLLFISLLIVAVLMMAAGLLANLYLIWSVQRGQSQAIDAARQSVEAEAKLAKIREGAAPN